MKTTRTVRRLLGGLLLAPCLCLSLPSAARSAGSTADDLAVGIRQVHEGEFDVAVVTLDGVVRRLVAEKAAASQIAKAHVYLAIAYMGLAQVEQARQRFLEALKADKTMELSPKEFPPNVIELFAQVKKEEMKPPKAAPAAATAPVLAATPTPALRPATAKASKGGSKLPLILLGVGAAGGGAVALAAGGGGGSSTTPTPIPTPTPAPTCSAGQVQLVGVAFDPRTAACPRGSDKGPVSGTVRANVNNASAAAVTIQRAELSLRIVALGPGNDNGGCCRSTPAITTPSEVAPRASFPLSVPFTGDCTNPVTWPSPGTGYQDWGGTLTVTTSCGTVVQPVEGTFRLTFP